MYTWNPKLTTLGHISITKHVQSRTTYSCVFPETLRRKESRATNCKPWTKIHQPSTMTQIVNHQPIDLYHEP